MPSNTEIVENLNSIEIGDATVYASYVYVKSMPDRETKIVKWKSFL